MRYFLAAVLAMVLVIPPASVGAGQIGGDIFIIQGVNSKDVSENLFCGDLDGSRSWLLATLAETGSVIVAGEGAKVGKGPRMKDKGAARRFEDAPARPRGVTATDVTATMKASFNAKTGLATATVVDKSNGETLESPGGSVSSAYQITNLTGDTTCAALIEGLEESGSITEAVRQLGR